MPEPLLSLQAAADQLGVSERFMRRLISERRIQFVKVGRYVKFHQSTISEYIARHTVAATR